MRTYEEAVKIMVDWWVEKSFKTINNQNNGDDSALTSMLMNVNSMLAQDQITTDKIDRFSTKLTELLLKENDFFINKYGFKYEALLSVDYNPNKPLQEACEYAEIKNGCLPCKTFTRINKDNIIEGRYQYGGDWFKI